MFLNKGKTLDKIKTPRPLNTTIAPELGNNKRFVTFDVIRKMKEMYSKPRLNGKDVDPSRFS